MLAWSRYRFARFAAHQPRETTLRLLAECLEELGGVPADVLADRTGCIRAGTVANIVVPYPEYVRFAAHYGFRPHSCAAAVFESTLIALCSRQTNRSIFAAVIGAALPRMMCNNPRESWREIRRRSLHTTRSHQLQRQ